MDIDIKHGHGHSHVDIADGLRISPLCASQHSGGYALPLFQGSIEMPVPGLQSAVYDEYLETRMRTVLEAAAIVVAYLCGDDLWTLRDDTQSYYLFFN